MQKSFRRIRLDASQHLSVRFLAGAQVSLEGDKKSTWETITRVVKFSDPRYGTVDITRGMLLQIVANFNQGAYGQDIFLDVAHAPNAGAAAKIVKLTVEGNRLRGLMEWTPYGIDAVKSKGITYLSIEYVDDYVDPETQEHRGPLMLGAALVVRPAVKGNQPVDATRLSEPGDDDNPLIVHPELQTKLLQDLHTMHKNALEKLKLALIAKKLAASVIASLMLAAEAAVAHILDEAAATLLLTSFDDMGTTLAENTAPVIALAAPTISVGMTAEQVIALMASENARTAAGVKVLADQRAGNVKLLTETIDAVTSFDADVKRALTEAVAGLVTAGMTSDQVVALAAVQIKQGNDLAVARQLSSLGFHAPLGSVRIPGISVPFEEPKKLAGIYHDNLKLTSYFAEGKLHLSAKDTTFVNRVLGEFDRIHATQISNEVKMLSGGVVNISDTNLPVGFRREVIREALSDLRVLELVQAMTDFSATVTTQIPYELRDMSAVMNDGIVYEGQPIHRGGIGQYMDTAYILPMKLAMLISNEAIHFTQAAAINWDAMARNVESNARIMRELICRRLLNELQRASDAFGSIAVAAESFAAQLNGATSQVKTAGFPVVRAFQQRDLQGTVVGSAVNPIVVVLNSAPCLQYDGTNLQAAGTYYRINSYNLGYVQFVSQLGAAVTPANTGTNTIAYSRATNIAKVDLDIASGSTYEKQLNKVLQGIGARKALLSGQRFVNPDYLLMSPVLNDTITNAEQFALQNKRNGTDTTADGDLERVKGLPSYGTNAPGVDMGDERILIGQRGLAGYVVGKPFITGAVFEAVDSAGRPIGKKQAYGEEYSAIKVPTPVAGRMTSLLAYSFTGR